MDTIYELPSSKDVICCYVGGSYGFVAADDGGFKCLTCTYDTHNCTHITFLNRRIEAEDESLPTILYEIFPEQMQRNISTRPSCFSKKKFEYEPPIDIQVVLHNGLTSVLPYVNGSYEVMSNSVSATSCCSPCFSPWSLNDPRENGWMFENVKLFTMNDILMCTGEFY